MCFRMAQFLLGAISLLAHIVLAQRPTNGHRKVTDVIHLNAVGSAFRDEPRHGFQRHFVAHEDERDMPLHARAGAPVAEFPASWRWGTGPK